MLYWIFELCYACFRVARTPRDAENLAAIPFGVIVFLPVISLLAVYGINIFPFESSLLTVLLFLFYIGLTVLAGYYLIVKPFGFRKRVRERGVIIRTYSVGRKIINFVLFFILFCSFIFVPALVVQVQKLLAEML